MKKRYGLIYAILAILCVACSQGGKKNSGRRQLRVDSQGLPSEVLLVADKAVMNSDLKDTLQDMLEGSVPGLMNAEPYFRVLHLYTDVYGPKYCMMHSRVEVRLNPAQKEPVLGVAYDQEAVPQVVLQVIAPDVDALRPFLSQVKQGVRDLLLDHQLEVQANVLRKKYSKKVADDARKQVGYGVCAPEEIKFDKKGDHFLWASTNREEKDLNVVLYTYPWDGSNVFSNVGFAQKRDSVMQRNIPGSTPEQWMATVWEEGEPLVTSRMRKVNNRWVQEVRGLWEMHAGAMGGPFVSHVRIDTAASRVVVAEGFVYSPSTSKRDLVRQVEAMLRTVE